MKDNNIISQQAGLAGLVLGLVSGAYGFLTYGFNDFFLSHTLVNYLADIVKTAACIFLMVFFIKKFHSENNAGSYAQNVRACRRLGVFIALYSALITALCNYAALRWCFPDLLSEAIDTTLAQMGTMMDSNTMSKMDEMLPKMPMYTMIFSFLWCLLFGSVVSAIASGSICKQDNPFSDNSKDDDII